MSLTTKRLTMLVVSLALFMDVLDTNIINTAIPAISHSFAVSPVDLKVALISYLLSMAIFIPASGWAADRFGAKPVFMSALALFTVASFWCGYVETLRGLMVARCVQGIGGAFMISLGRLLIARAFPRHELVAAMNTVIIVVAVGVMLGPYLGGVITERFSWPWIFWINIPAGVMTLLLAYFGLCDTTVKAPKPFDGLGFLFFGGGLSVLMLALSEVSETEVDLGRTQWMIFAALMMLVTYAFHARRRQHPIIRLDVFRIRTFRISILGNIFARLGFGATPFLLPLLFQLVLNLKPEVSGALLVPIAFGIIAAKLMVLNLLRYSGYKRFLMINTVIVGVSVMLFQLITLQSSLYFIAGLTFLFGLAIACQFTAMNSLAFADVEDDALSGITSITSTVQMFSQSLGVALGAILLGVFSGVSAGLHVLSLTAFHHTFLAMSALTFVSSVIFLSLKPSDGVQLLSKR